CAVCCRSSRGCWRLSWLRSCYRAAARGVRTRIVTRTYLALADAFSGADCERIIALADDAPTGPGPLYGGSGRDVDPALRDVRSSLVARADAPWLFDRLDTLFAAGAEEFGLPVGPVSELIQVLLYGEGGHFRMWHTDAGTDSGAR